MIKLVLVAVLGALLLPGAAFGQATRTWVSGVGDDANPCSRTAPCKTWAGAISKTATAGEIDALDSGGFGAVTITKSITLNGGESLASILVNGTNGVVVNIAQGNPSDPDRRVVLRNLSITGAGSGAFAGLAGVRVDQVKSLHLEQVDIGKFSADAIDFTPLASSGDSLSLSLDRVSIRDNNRNGLVAAAATADQQLRVLVRDSTVASTTGTVGIDGERGIGISADTGAHVWLTQTSVFDNLIGLKTFARLGQPGVIDDFCDNQIAGNADNGTAPNRLCPQPEPQTNTVTNNNNTVTQGPTVVVEKPAPAICVVPELTGLKLSAAKRGLKAAGCRLGKVTRKRSSRSSVGRVTSQRTKAGRKVKLNTKVHVKVGKR